MLVFFDGILIYNKTWDAHVQHVDRSLQLIWENMFLIKCSKSHFGVLEVEYMGHIFGQDGVRVDPKKTVGM